MKHKAVILPEVGDRSRGRKIYVHKELDVTLMKNSYSVLAKIKCCEPFVAISVVYILVDSFVEFYRLIQKTCIF